MQVGMRKYQLILGRTQFLISLFLQQANLDGNQQNSANCCSGSHNTPQTCPPSGVQYYSYFKGKCPKSYVYAYDESSGTALFTCDSAKNADYTLTFCP